MLSTLVIQQRLRIVGHGLRHDQTLRHLVGGEWMPQVHRRDVTDPTTKARPRSSLQQIATETGLPQADWIDAASDRDKWRAMLQHACYKNELDHWTRYGQQRRRRWCDLTRLQHRIDLLLCEASAETFYARTQPHYTRILVPYSHPPITNSFNYAKHPPLFQRDRDDRDRSSTPPPRTPPPSSRTPAPTTPPPLRTKWIWTPAVPATTDSPTPSRRRRDNASVPPT